MPKYESPGTENLRADAHVYDGGDTPSPSGSGKDCGGTENLKESVSVKTAETKSPGTYAKDSRPAGLSRYNGEAV